VLIGCRRRRSTIKPTGGNPLAKNIISNQYFVTKIKTHIKPASKGRLSLSKPPLALTFFCIVPFDRLAQGTPAGVVVGKKHKTQQGQVPWQGCKLLFACCTEREAHLSPLAGLFGFDLIGNCTLVCFTTKAVDVFRFSLCKQIWILNDIQSRHC